MFAAKNFFLTSGGPLPTPSVEYLVVAGGGAGHYNSGAGAGGGGAGDTEQHLALQ